MIILCFLSAEKTGELDFSMFLTMMHRQIQQEEPKSEILAALRMFDKQKRGYIPASELRAKLTKMGEKLTNTEGKNEGCEQQGNLVCSALNRACGFVLVHFAMSELESQSEGQ